MICSTYRACARGRVTLRKQTLELAEVVAQAVEASRPLLEARRHHFDIHLPDEPIFVEADATRLSQVILNLLNNAAKYTEEGGYINLSVERAGAEVVVRVRIAASASLRKHCRKSSSCSSRAASLDRAQGGLGIGLTVVRRLVELHGGAVQALSEGLGRGRSLSFVCRLCLHRYRRPATVTLESLMIDMARVESLTSAGEFSLSMTTATALKVWPCCSGCSAMWYGRPTTARPG